MQLSISGKQVRIGKAFQVQVEEALTEFNEKHQLKPIETTVTVSKPGFLFHSDVTSHIGRGVKLRSQGEGGDAYVSFANALEKLTLRLRRHKKRLRDHHHGHDIHMDARVISAEVLANNPDIGQHSEDGAPPIIAEMHKNIPSLSVGEAAVRLDLEDRPALIFRNNTTNHINVLYRRDDGNIGWVDPKEE